MGSNLTSFVGFFYMQVIPIELEEVDMNTFPEYLVYSVHTNPDEPDIIEKVKALYHYHPEGRLNTIRELTKYQIIEMLQSGNTTIKTGKKSDGHYHVQHDIHVVTIYGITYLKIKKDLDTRDFIGDLEKY